MQEVKDRGNYLDRMYAEQWMRRHGIPLEPPPILSKGTKICLCGRKISANAEMGLCRACAQTARLEALGIRLPGGVRLK